MKTRYSHISLPERRKIERWRVAGMSATEIAERLGRHRSTIFRELRRNRFHDAEIPEFNGYYALVASDIAGRRRSRRRKLVLHPDLRTRVETCLRAGWSPEQIAGRMQLENASVRVCQETIYRHVYSPDGKQAELWRHLATRRRKRRGYRRRKRLPPRFAPELSILFRPDVVAHRRQFGHWGEAEPWPLRGRVSPPSDLVLFRQKFGPANVTTMIERTSRFLVVLKNPEKRAKPIMAQIAKALAPLPFSARRSVTFDRGTEFVDWPHLQAKLGARTWFCEAQSPWQKAGVEHANRRLRSWLPRDTDPGTLTQPDLRELCATLNATPRKCLGWRTPAEVFRANVLGRGHRRERLSMKPKSHFR